VEKQAFTPRIHSVDQMTWRDALKIGFAQAFSLIPGTSRSGATIMGGMIFGLSRTTATEFSFFLAIPTMFAATFYDLYKHWALLHAHDLAVFATGFAAAFVSAFFAVRALLRYIAHHSFVVFAWYRIVFGVILLVYYRAELFHAMS
jgi:undecaprenyl-diphosphatase